MMAAGLMNVGTSFGNDLCTDLDMADFGRMEFIIAPKRAVSRESVLTMPSDFLSALFSATRWYISSSSCSKVCPGEEYTWDEIDTFSESSSAFFFFHRWIWQQKSNNEEQCHNNGKQCFYNVEQRENKSNSQR